ncbi:hypothetical protein BKA62DRAFT_775029 [Auriculariales sp. MPI-PUGE-AT-0066]|nr:hypothetical protein BKA62DRAFT_775029 [Auriculariales sp. MPI-PUGE-AT-0066]
MTEKIRTFHRGEITSRSIVPLHEYLLAPEATDGKCLFTEIKLRAGHAEISTLPEKQTDMVIVDESFITYTEFLKVIDRTTPDPPLTKTVTVVGAGVSGLCAAYELKRIGYKVKVLEASSRVGGRVITFRDPVLAPGLHAEGGAMRIPHDHYLLHRYMELFGLDKQLIPFEMANKFIYLSGLPEGQRTLSYNEFDQKLRDKDHELLALFPDLLDEERGKTCDELFDAAVQPVKDLWVRTYNGHGGEGHTQPPYPVNALVAAYAAITTEYDKYTLRSYLTDVAKWSEDALNLYDLGNAHVVFENGFIESFKDAFLSSNQSGSEAGMQQLQSGMDAVPKAFAERTDPLALEPLMNDITFGARVKSIGFPRETGETAHTGRPKIVCRYDNPSGAEVSVESDYLILAIPYTAQRAITKEKAFVPKQEMAIRDVRYVEVTKIILQYKERWWKEQFGNLGLGTDVDQFKHTNRGAIMAAYTFEQDATILGALSPARRAQLAARDIDMIFPTANSLKLLEAATAQVFPSDELAGGSAFCYFGPGQKSTFLSTMCKPDWENRVFFAGEQASYTHGWIQGALEAALRCVIQISGTITVASDIKKVAA